MHSKRQRPLGSILIIIIIIVIIITDGFSRGFGTGSCATSEATAAGAGQGRWHRHLAPSRSHLSGLLTQLLQQPQRIELLLLRLRSRNCLHLSASLLFPTFLLPLPMALPPRLLFFYFFFFAVFVLFFFSRLDVQLSICNIKHLHLSIWRGYQVGAGELELKLELELELKLKLQLETAAVVAVVLFA
ncbi:GD22199 [Drosophila simulans]|uniref:GD22199 n=1 Tax=Drosophila simulans TaxID=7240 RepID=B4QA99_DROSI|nr:GD22199 [Drosophila simulans]